jgi:acyl-CoA dehydrogenase
MVDEGVVAWGDYGGERVLGIRLNWRKRYISLGPVATVLGLAFKLRDPDGLMGGTEDLGITVALVPTDLPGVSIGRRHLPCFQAFQNGPNEGRDVFVPLEAVIGGREGIGEGWKMLMGALAAGRGISLPSLAAAATAFAARSTGAYARVREQFGVPIGKFEGVRERLARLAGLAYEIDAARRFTCIGLDAGHRPSVISAIMKSQATYRMRTAVDDAMDVHGGKAIIDGPRNWLGNLHRTVPIAITVEGANILTRHLIVFGQGVIRCHPHLLDEMLALEADDPGAPDRFNAAFRGHVGHAVRSLGRAALGAWSGGRLSAAPAAAGRTARHYRRLSRYAAALVTATDIALLSLGGKLKRRELTSARLGDVLSDLYFMSAVLKRFEDDGRPQADEPLVEWCMATSAARVEAQLDAFLRNLPSRVAAAVGRVAIMPLGPRRHGPDDALIRRCAALLLEPSETRERLTEWIWRGKSGEGIASLERAFDLVTATEPLRKRMREAEARNVAEAMERGVISAEQAERLRERDAAVAEAIAVDDFAPEDLSPAAAEREVSDRPALKEEVEA